MDDDFSHFSSLHENRHSEFIRFLLAAFAAPNSTPHDAELLSCLAEKIFFQRFPTDVSQDKVIGQLRERVLTKELLENHAKLQEILFPLLTLQGSWEKSAHARADDVSLNLYTYPEIFAQACPSPEKRQLYLKDLALNVQETLAAQAKENHAFESFLTKLIDRKPPDQHKKSR